MKDKKVVFVAGAHGAGKGYLCSRLAPQLDAQHVTASNLIRNRKNLGKAKAISGINTNQSILVEELIAFKTAKSIVLLDGHFCLYNTEFEMEILPSELFRALNITYTVLLTCDPTEIIGRLVKRDQKTSGFSLESVKRLQLAEQKHARKISEALNVPLTELDVTEEPTTAVLSALSLGIKRRIEQ